MKMQKEDLLKVREEKKKKQPFFARQEVTKKKKLRNNSSWRRPRGKHSKVRLNKAGHEAMPTIGWASPKEVRHLHRSGLKKILVYSLIDLEKINKEEEGIIIGRAVGKRKRLEIIKKAEEKGIKIFNIKDTKSFVEKIMKEREERKKKQSEKMAKKTKKKETKPKKEEKKEEKEMGEEEKKKEEKKEKDKVLTKKT